MTYDVIIATRNRPDILRVSIPLILCQDPAPHRVIIVDSSDNHEKTREAVIEIMADCQIEFEILQSKANLPLQRNIGIQRARSPVVVFPDDDSFWWPGVAESFMRIYERDTDEVIGGVCAIPDTNELPPGTPMSTTGMGNKMRIADRIRGQIAGVRYRFDSIVCPNPIYLHGRSCWRECSVPKWLVNENATLTEWATGLCMSFRRDIILPYGFNEDLGVHVGWAAYEDAEISFHVLQKHLLVGAHNAKVFHCKYPSKRGGGFNIGFINQFNCAYVVCLYSPKGSAARSAIQRYGKYKALQYMLSTRSKFGRERLRGHLLAMRYTKIILNTPDDSLRQRYLELCQKALTNIG